MPKRRKVSNLLALTLLTCLVERPMHPYEMATMLRSRGKDKSINIRWGSLYTVVQNLAKHGFIEATGTSRQGRKPERTVYRITDAGRAELHDWLRELVGEPQREYTRFEAGLSDAGVLHPDEVIALLRRRLQTLEADISDQRKELEQAAAVVPRVFLIETEYHLAMSRAEAEWVRGLLAEMQDGALSGIAQWRAFHDLGVVPADLDAWREVGRDSGERPMT